VSPDGPDSAILHATAVAASGRAALITGPSGAGKSGLALDLISRGCTLIADDQTRIYVRDGVLLAACPNGISGKIEARGLGLLSVPQHGPAPVRVVVDLSRPATARLPQQQKLILLGLEIELVLAGGLPNVAAAIHLFLTAEKTT